LIYGIGFGKSFWRTRVRAAPRVKRRMFLPGLPTCSATTRRELTFDDPDFENIDVFDAMWDPYGTVDRGSSCGGSSTASWLRLDACLDRIESGACGTPSRRSC
jgi:hypothetical protein